MFLPKVLLGLFKKNKAVTQPVSKYTYGIDNLNDDVIGDLPDPQGIPIVQTNVIIERMQRELSFIRSELGLTEEEFKKYVVPTCISFIEFADLLPASEYKHHATGGGLIYHSFDVAKRGMRAAQHTQFPNQSGIISDTQQSRKQWKTATVLACLLHDSGKVITDMVVTNGKDGDYLLKWDSHHKTIYQWSEVNKLDRYFVEWSKDRYQKHQAASLTMLQRLIPQETWSWINSAPEGKYIHNCLLGFLSDHEGTNPIAKIVSECDAESVRQDMFHNRSQITKQLKRIPISELLADIMRFNILERKWSINTKNAKIWYVNDELYITWDSAVPEMIDEMIKGGFSIPEVPTVLAKIMVEEGMATAFSDDEVYHTIYPIVLGDKSKPVPLRCLKLNNPSRIIQRLHKVYSIDEHKTGSVNKAPDQAKNLPKEQPVVAKSQTKPNKPTYETAAQTIGRVLGIMKADQEKIPDVETVPETHYPLPEPVSEQEYCSEKIAEQADTNSTGINNLAEQSIEPGTSEDKSTTQKQRYDPVVDFITSNFGQLKVLNDVVYVPAGMLNEIAERISEEQIDGITLYTAISRIRSSEYISIITD